MNEEQINPKRMCPHCDALTVIPDGYCGNCRQCTLPPLPPPTDVCPECKGRGFLFVEHPDCADCPTCQGTGKKPVEKGDDDQRDTTGSFAHPKDYMCHDCLPGSQPVEPKERDVDDIEKCCKVIASDLAMDSAHIPIKDGIIKTRLSDCILSRESALAKRCAELEWTNKNLEVAYKLAVKSAESYKEAYDLLRPTPPSGESEK